MPTDNWIPYAQLAVENQRPTYVQLEQENRQLKHELGAALRIIEAHEYDIEELRRLREDNRRLLHLFEEMNARRSAAKEKE